VSGGLIFEVSLLRTRLMRHVQELCLEYVLFASGLGPDTHGPDALAGRVTRSLPGHERTPSTLPLESRLSSVSRDEHNYAGVGEAGKRKAPSRVGASRAPCAVAVRCGAARARRRRAGGGAVRCRVHGDHGSLFCLI
jgi:hypothetical protein